MERKVAIADTGFVVALLNRSDTKHPEAATVYLEIKNIILPQTVLAEVAYLVGRDAGSMVVVAFLKGLRTSRFELASLTSTDIERTASILETYADSRIDFVDATVMSIAERMKSTTILTLDRRDFTLFRPRHCNSFRLLP